MFQGFINQKVNIVVFFTKNNENTYPRGRVPMQMYRVVSQTKRGIACTCI